jgi:hypothetical protein
MTGPGAFRHCAHSAPKELQALSPKLTESCEHAHRVTRCSRDAERPGTQAPRNPALEAHCRQAQAQAQAREHAKDLQVMVWMFVLMAHQPFALARLGLAHSNRTRFSWMVCCSWTRAATPSAGTSPARCT